MAAELHEIPNATNPRAYRRLEAAILVAVIGTIALLAITAFTACRDAVWIDPTTGSIKKETQWFGQTTSTIVEQSAIEKWTNEHNAPHSNHWKFLHATLKAALGNTIGCQCANAPPIYFLELGSLDERFVSDATDDEINEFVRVMRAGTDDETQKAVDAAIQKAITKAPVPPNASATTENCGL
jgi:hypothetical protein